MEALLAVVLGFVSAGLLWYAWQEIRTTRSGQAPPGRLQEKMRPEGPSEDEPPDFEPPRSELADPESAGSGRPEGVSTGTASPEPLGADPAAGEGAPGAAGERPGGNEPAEPAPEVGPESPEPPPAEGSYDYELYALQGDVGQGFRVRRTSDGEVIPWRSLPVKEGLLAFQVAGIDEHLDAAQLAEFAPGEPIRLVPVSGVPESEDPEVDAPPTPRIAVCDAAGEHKVGYVSEEKAELVGRLIEADPGYRSMVLWETPREGRVVGIRILITASDASIRFPDRLTERDSASPS